MALIDLPDPFSDEFKPDHLFKAFVDLCKEDYGTDDMEKVADF